MSAGGGETDGAVAAAPAAGDAGSGTMREVSRSAIVLCFVCACVFIVNCLCFVVKSDAFQQRSGPKKNFLLARRYSLSEQTASLADGDQKKVWESQLYPWQGQITSLTR